MAINNNASNVLGYKCEALYYSERYEEALKCVEKILEIKPDDIYQWWNFQGNILNALKRYKEAVFSFREALKINPNYLDATYGLGLVLYNLEEYQQAIVELNKVLSQQPDSIFYRGCAFLHLKQYEKAITDFDALLDINPDYLQAWQQRGTALYYLREYPDAIISFNQALQLQSDPWSFYNRGCCYALQGENDKAVASLQEAIALDLSYLETAKTDTDFDSIRELPEFQAIIERQD